MIKICLCDDDENILNFYTEKIKNISKKTNTAIEIEKFNSGGKVINAFENDPNSFKILIIDILMKSINGIETAKSIRKNGYNGIIIFLTSSEEFALEAFEVEPLNYIIKNNTQEKKFENIFLKALIEIKKDDNNKLIICNKQTKIVINLSTIIYIESLNKKVIIHKVCEGREEINNTLSNIYEKVKVHGFVRCHKSYIINSKYLDKFNRTECTLKDGTIIPIGRRYTNSFEQEIIENEFENIIL